MILFLLIVIGIALLMERFSLRVSPDQIQYSMEPSKRSVEQGEEFVLRTTVDNESKYPIPYLMMQEAIPDVVEIKEKDSLKLKKNGNFLMHNSTIFVKKHQRVKRSIHASIYHRGVYHFRYADLSFGDFLGLKEVVWTVNQERSIIVYPRCLDDERLTKVLSDVMGQISVRSFLNEDPMLVTGYRDYTGREPLKYISFPMSAKRNQLTVKEFDHTREELVDLIFDVSYKGEFEHYFNQLETLFCIVRTICETFEKRDISYRLITNAYYSTMEVRGVNVISSGGSGGNSFMKILDMLAMSSGAVMCKTEELFDYAFSNHANEKEFVYISQRRDEETDVIRTQMEQLYGVNVHCIYGEDYEEQYLEDSRRREEMAV